MTVVTSSNSHNVPETTKMKLFTVGGIQFVITRYSQEAMNKVYGGQLVQYIASKLRSLIFRLFQDAHIKHSPGHMHDKGVFHIPLQADFPKVVVHVQAPCARAHESSMSMLMELSCAQGGSECPMSMLMEASWAQPWTLKY